MSQSRIVLIGAFGMVLTLVFVRLMSFHFDVGLVDFDSR